MASDKAPKPKTKQGLSPLRAILLAVYIFVVVVLVKLYWPGWPYPDKPHPAAQAPTTGVQIPQN